MLGRTEKSLQFQNEWQTFREPGDLIPTLLPDKLLEIPKLLPVVGIVGLDIENRALPVIFAGSDLQQYLGFEIAGVDLVSFNFFPNETANWERRNTYFEHPCGFYEVVTAQTEKMGKHTFAVTLLPIFGEEGARRLLVHVDATDAVRNTLDPNNLKGELVSRSAIDIGAGLPANAGF